MARKSSKKNSIKPMSISIPKIDVASNVNEQKAAGGLEGADRIAQETANWMPSMTTPDIMINRDKEIIDARGRDRMMNDGYILGALNSHKDNIVGAHYRLNAQPDYQHLKLSEQWAEEFQDEVESKFSLSSESFSNWLDASGVSTFTGLIRLGLASFFYSGEILATAEWIRDKSRPFNTAIQLIIPDRLSNPMNADDTETMRRGVEKDSMGKPIAYHIRVAHDSEYYSYGKQQQWKRVVAKKPWGRTQVIHIFEPFMVEQSRGISAMVSVLKQMKMTQKFSDIVLQQAVLDASYAMAIESELPPEAVYQHMGYNENSSLKNSLNHLQMMETYFANGKGLRVDGVKIPVLPPGTKMSVVTPGKTAGVGEAFEASLLSHIAAPLGLSREQFTHDYTKTNFASARAAMNETFKYMNSIKAMITDKFASIIYSLWLEEMINSKKITSMPRNAPNFYDGLNKESYSACSWIGPSRSHMDENKAASAAIDRLNNNLSTYEEECGALGKDYRKTFKQIKREISLAKELGISRQDLSKILASKTVTGA